MSDTFIGEIRMFAGNFAPKGWAFCHGQQIPIAQNTALFSLLGTYYGGNGTTYFNLPDLRDRAPMHWGEGPGLTPRSLGEQAGSAAVSLIINQMPAHIHQLNAANQTGETNVPQAAVWAQAPQQGKFIKKDTPLYHGTVDRQMDPRALSTTGMGAPHNNRQPYLAVNFIICLTGNFPPRND